MNLYGSSYTFFQLSLDSLTQLVSFLPLDRAQLMDFLMPSSYLMDDSDSDIYQLN